MFGLLCQDNIEIVKHSLFNNFRLALYNIFGKESFKDINHLNDINEISHLFIVDEHYFDHAKIWQRPDPLKTINNKNIRVIVFNFEKIFNSYFPWNTIYQNALNQFKSFYQFVSDVDDAKILKKDVINKQMLSKDTKFNITLNPIKQDKILFIGQLQDKQYQNRRNVIQEFIRQHLPLDVITPNRKMVYLDFLDKINEYKYILNPLGTGKFVNLRHFEALYCGTIPIQQMTPDMIVWNQDIKNCVLFTDFNNLSEKIFNNKIQIQKYYLEDYFNHINLKNYI